MSWIFTINLCYLQIQLELGSMLWQLAHLSSDYGNLDSAVSSVKQSEPKLGTHFYVMLADIEYWNHNEGSILVSQVWLFEHRSLLFFFLSIHQGSGGSKLQRCLYAILAVEFTHGHSQWGNVNGMLQQLALGWPQNQSCFQYYTHLVQEHSWFTHIHSAL